MVELMQEMEAVVAESDMSKGFVLSDNILKNDVNDNKFDGAYSHKASKSLNDLDLFTKGQPFDFYKELREKAPIYFHQPMPTAVSYTHLTLPTILLV